VHVSKWFKLIKLTNSNKINNINKMILASANFSNLINLFLISNFKSGINNKNNSLKLPVMKTNLFTLIILLVLMEVTIAQNVTYQLPNRWKAKRCNEIVADGTQITSEYFKPDGWMDAVVPGTILTTLLHNNQVPDPYFGMNNNMIPDVYETGREFYTYWFYNEFELPDIREGQQVWLNFRGINYFADIFLNGQRVNNNVHQGMYLREKYLITTLLKKGKSNKIAVWVAPPDPAGNAFMGQGGDGTIGRSVTMQCTAGWDWICPIRDRNTGIWDQVAIEYTGEVDLRNPYIQTRVPGVRIPINKQAPAYIKASVELINTSDKSMQGILSLQIEGKAKKQKIILKPLEQKMFAFSEIEIANPRLWWPNGMGDQSLYTAKFSFQETDGVISDTEQTIFGIRETGNYFDPQIKAQVFTVNGQKVFVKGGNWIASDALLRLSKERYEAEVRMHAEMHMNMIRIWGGGLTERPEFYDACDKYGILIWQDLWISGDCNGEWYDPLKKESQTRRKAYPDNHDLFLESVTDQVKMLRNHPSLYLWCGGNETPPPDDIKKALKKIILPALDSARFFLDYSTSPELMTNTIGGVGDGPYGLQEPDKIFTNRSFPFNPEVGSVGIPNYDGLRKIIPEEELIPPTDPRGTKSWLYHKYLPLRDFPDRYGKVRDIHDFCLKAQLVSYEQYRALQEGFNYKMWDWYSGMLVWKNQNPWTALRGFFYDYFLDYTGGYFGYKHGAAPVHIQLNLNDSVVCLINQTAIRQVNLSALIQLYEIHGKLLHSEKMTVNLEAQKSHLLKKIDLPEKENEVFFLKLLLLDNDKILDENLYWLTRKPKSYSQLNELQQVQLQITLNESGTELTAANPSNETAFFIRLKVVNSDNELILPVFFTDNYFTLLPGESKTLGIDVTSAKKASGSENLKLKVEGWNIVEDEFSFKR
jgi:mannosylglycoprotein endo-beta-mannosidase